MMRDARINMIGEGANDVLRVFTALVGMRDVGLDLEGVLQAIQMPVGNMSRLARFGSRKLRSLFVAPEITVRNPELEGDAAALARQVGRFGKQVERSLMKYQREIVDRQYPVARIADAAIDLYVSSCVLRRMDAMLREFGSEQPESRFELSTGRYYLLTAARRIEASLRGLSSNTDAETTALGNQVLARSKLVAP